MFFAHCLTTHLRKCQTVPTLASANARAMDATSTTSAPTSARLQTEGSMVRQTTYAACKDSSDKPSTALDIMTPGTDTVTCCATTGEASGAMHRRRATALPAATNRTA
eukprot:394669_1